MELLHIQGQGLTEGCCWLAECEKASRKIALRITTSTVQLSSSCIVVEFVTMKCRDGAKQMSFLLRPSIQPRGHIRINNSMSSINLWWAVRIQFVSFKDQTLQIYMKRVRRRWDETRGCFKIALIRRSCVLCGELISSRLLLGHGYLINMFGNILIIRGKHWVSEGVWNDITSLLLINFKYSSSHNFTNLW